MRDPAHVLLPSLNCPPSASDNSDAPQGPGRLTKPDFKFCVPQAGAANPSINSQREVSQQQLLEAPGGAHAGQRIIQHFLQPDISLQDRDPHAFPEIAGLEITPTPEFTAPLGLLAVQPEHQGDGVAED